MGHACAEPNIPVHVSPHTNLPCVLHLVALLQPCLNPRAWAAVDLGVSLGGDGTVLHLLSLCVCCH